MQMPRIAEPGRALPPDRAIPGRRLGAGGLVLAAALAWPQLLAGPTAGRADGGAGGGRLPILRVDAGGKTPAAAGAELGRLSKTLFPDLERRWDAHLAGVLSQGLCDRWIAAGVAEGLDPDHRAQVAGFADALSLIGRSRLGDGLLSMDELWLVQSLPDIGRQAQGSGFGVFGRHAAGGSSLVGRNLDATPEDPLGELAVIHRYASPDGVVVTVGFAGLLGAVTGFNDRGLFLALFDAPSGPGQPEPPPGRAVGFDLRRTLETQARIAGAARRLGRGSHAAGHSVLLADPAGVAVLEQPPSGPARLRTEGSATRADMPWGLPGRIAVVNCFALDASPSDCPHLRDRYRWERFRTLAGFEPGGTRAQPGALGDIMFDRANRPYAIFGADTLLSLVFAPATTELFLYAAPAHGDPPAEPLMHRYPNLAREPGTRGPGSGLGLLWLVLAAVATLAAGIRLAFARPWRRGKRQQDLTGRSQP